MAIVAWLVTSRDDVVGIEFGGKTCIFHSVSVMGVLRTMLNLQYYLLRNEKFGEQCRCL